ncbi:MAG: DUF3881 family protein [Lachnospiraceae bacterium]|nr:DUF3881 family protein [Lachnospiraceae bacterium]
MHRYLRAIGFSHLTERKKLQELMTDIVLSSTERHYTTGSDETLIAEFSKDFAQNIGITVCGVFDEEDKFIADYYYPYLKGSAISSEEDVSVEQHAAKDSYAGVCDDIRLGVSLIFYLQNRIPYIKANNLEQLPVRGTTLNLSALSVQGNVMMPIVKNEIEKTKVKKATVNRQQLLAAARQGDEDAIENLTLEDMDMYTTISKKIHKDDVFSLVDTYFMPYGVECDQYSVLGEITHCKQETNYLTGENIYIMGISCNELEFDLCINQEDLYGEPEVGRRFKGTVWMQGYINFPG